MHVTFILYTKLYIYIYWPIVHGINNFQRVLHFCMILCFYISYTLLPLEQLAFFQPSLTIGMYFGVSHPLFSLMGQWISITFTH